MDGSDLFPPTFLSKSNVCDTLFSLLAGCSVYIPKGQPGKENYIGRNRRVRRAGPPGPHGVKGEAGPVGKVAAEQRNWKQCAWKKYDLALLRCVQGRKITNLIFRVGVTGHNY